MERRTQDEGLWVSSRASREDQYFTAVLWKLGSFF